LIFEIADADSVAADESFWTIYDGAFPAEEREPRSVILDAARAGVGVITRAREEGATVALASAHKLQDPAALFLVYLAVAPNLRGQGVGKQLFDFTCGKWSQIIWEVDLPERAGSEAERARRERRIGFFRRAGGELVARPYRQPPLGPELPPVEMQLMARPLPQESERLVRAIYFEKYGRQNGIAVETLTALLG
jgi:GNAT superfamily N-acetyltransferase